MAGEESIKRTRGRGHPRRRHTTEGRDNLREMRQRFIERFMWDGKNPAEAKRLAQVALFVVGLLVAGGYIAK